MKRPVVKEYFEVFVGRSRQVVYRDEKGYLRSKRRNKLVSDKSIFTRNSKRFTTEEIKEIIIKRANKVKWDDIGIEVKRCPSTLCAYYSRWKKDGLVDLYTGNTNNK